MKSMLVYITVGS